MKKYLLSAGVLFAGLMIATAEETAPTEKPAEKPAEKMQGNRFEAADTNGDGAISLEEFKVVHEARAAQRKEKLGDKFDPAREAKMPTADAVFTKLDKDGNGGLSKEEMAAGGDRVRERMKQREGGAEGGKRRGEGKGPNGGKHGEGAAKAPEAAL